MVIESRVVEDAVVDKLLESAAISEEATGYQDVLQRSREASKK